MDNATAAALKQNDRVSVSDGPGFTLGYGTVIQVHPPTRKDDIMLVEVALDDTGELGLFATWRLKVAQ